MPHRNASAALPSTPQDKLLQKLFAASPPAIIFDIGACNGSSSVHYGAQFPEAVMHLFEPVPSNHALVLETVRSHPELRMHAHQLALSDRSGTTVLHLSSAEGEMARHGNKSSSLLEPGRTRDVHPWLAFNERIEVPTMTLDDLCFREKIMAIDFIHMDVQGAELMVLTGASRMLPRIKTVWMEVERVPLYKGQPVKRDVETFMRSRGFVLAISTVGHLAGDQFWVNASFLNDQPNSVKRSISLDRTLGSIRSTVNTAWGAFRYRLRLRSRLKTVMGRTS